MNWKNPDSYGFAAVVAVIIHLLVAGLFLIEWPDSHSQRLEPAPQHLMPQHMMANVVQEENKAVKERQRKAEQAKKRKQRDAKRRAEKERQRKLDAKRKKEKARQEKLKQQKLAKQKAEAEKKRKAEAKRAAEQKIAQQKAAAAQAEQERLKQQELERQQAEQQLLEELAQEQAEAELREQQAAAERAERAAVMTSEFTGLIRQQVQSQWRYPPAVDASMEVELRLSLVPTGEVIQVQIIKSSGNQALDRSVEQAVKKASPLPVPDDIAVFEQNFRHFTMKFRPENASW